MGELKVIEAQTYFQRSHCERECDTAHSYTAAPPECHRGWVAGRGAGVCSPGGRGRRTCQSGGWGLPAMASWQTKGEGNKTGG